MVFAVLKSDKALAELAEQVDAHPDQITQWKAQLLEGAEGVFGGAQSDVTPPIEGKALHAKIGELTLENDLLERALTKAPPTDGSWFMGV